MSGNRIVIRQTVGESIIGIMSRRQNQHVREQENLSTYR